MNHFSIKGLVVATLLLISSNTPGQQTHVVTGDSLISRTLAYCNPQEAGVDSLKLTTGIDSVVTAGLEAGAYPGCQVLVARHGKTVFHKTYGYTNYKDSIPSQKDHIYDLASVTKITGSLPALMKLVDEGKLDPDARLSDYWPGWKKGNKKDLVIREILAHQAGLRSWIPYWKKTVKKNGEFKRGTFKTDSSEKYCEPVNSHLYLNSKYRKKIYRQIRRSKLAEEKKYLYSGLAFFIYPALIESITGRDYEEYIHTEFYAPLGAGSLGYNPSYRFPAERIIPTEYDSLFRKTQIKGWVHDESAAMMGGVSGNAGLFSTAGDLARIMQMYLDMGIYDGRRYISEGTMKEFTRSQYPDNENRRGLGFDKPLLENDTLPAAEQYPTGLASTSSFGHSGFTGTFTWADPEKDIVYVFLSNRVNPTRKNNLISEMNIRTSILEMIYLSIDKSKELTTEKSKELTTEKSAELPTNLPGK